MTRIRTLPTEIVHFAIFPAVAQASPRIYMRMPVLANDGVGLSLADLRELRDAANTALAQAENSITKN